MIALSTVGSILFVTILIVVIAEQVRAAQVTGGVVGFGEPPEGKSAGIVSATCFVYLRQQRIAFSLFVGAVFLDMLFGAVIAWRVIVAQNGFPALAANGAGLMASLGLSRVTWKFYKRASNELYRLIMALGQR